MKTPPFLLGAALLFWGWQTDFLAISIFMAGVLEAARYTKTRWEFSDDDFSRIWTVCTLLFLGVAVYAFTDNGGPARVGSFFQNPNPATQTGAGAATSRTASAMLRWLPMVLFVFVAAQVYSARAEIPLSTISLIMRRRWKKAAKMGHPLPPGRGMNVSYPYFAVCLFAASVHPGEGNTYFWGFCVLLGWALWVNRVRRFSVLIWGSALVLVLGSGFFGQHGLGRLQAYIQSLDPNWFERFARNRGTDPTHSRTAIGRIGNLKLSGKIVIRLEPEDIQMAPDYLREASYRNYDHRRYSWRSGSTRDSFLIMPQETNSGAFVLMDKPTLASTRITCYLAGSSREGVPVGLLPLPSGVARLERLPAFILRMNNLGAVLAEGPGLVSFEAKFGPGRTIDSPFNRAERYSLTNLLGRRSMSNLQEAERDALSEAGTNPDLFVNPWDAALLKEVTAGWNVPKGDRQQAMARIKELFSDFTYSTWQEISGFQSTNALRTFLTRTRSGHCEYYATATVLLLRHLGVPARYAVGYAVHERSGKEYVVRLRDAHSWCLVWNDRSQSWQDFDTTPSVWMEEENKHASPFEKLSDLWTWLGFQFAAFRWGQSNIRQYMLLALIPVMGLLVYQIFFRRKRKKQPQSARENLIWPGLDSEFYLIERKLAERGIIRQSNETVSQWLERALTHPEIAIAAEPLREILRLHYRYRFDPHGLSAPDREQLRAAVESCLHQMAALQPATKE